MGDFNNIKVGVDWADKGYICIGAKTSDALNLLPYAPYWRGTPTYLSTAGTSTFVRGIPFFATEKSMYGGMELRYTRAGAVVNDTILVGNDNSTTRTWVVTQNTSYQFYIYYSSITGNNTQKTNTSVLIDAWNGSSWTGIASTNMLDTLTNAPYSSNYLTGISFTTGASVTRIRLRIVVPSTGVTHFRLGAVKLIPSSASGQIWYNDGQALSLYDDITAYLKSADWKLGRTNAMDIMPSEGSATFLLNNASKIFSPEINTSPLYPNIKSNVRVSIVYQHGSYAGVDAHGWQSMFYGYTDTIDVDTSVYRDREATLTAYQGVKNLEKMRVRRRLYQNAYSDTYYWLQFGLRGGLSIPQRGYATATVGKSYVGSSYIQTPSDFVDTYPLAVNYKTLPYLGQLWADDDTGYTLLAELADFENGYVFVTRDGYWRVIPNDYMLAFSPVATLTMSMCSDITYKYGGEKWTAYRITPTFWAPVGSYPSNVVDLSEWSEWVRVPAGTSVYITTPYVYDGDFSTLKYQYGQRTGQDAEGRRVDDNSVSVTMNATNLFYLGQQYDNLYNPVPAYVNLNWAIADRYYVKNPNAFDIEVRIKTKGVRFQQTTGQEVIVSDDTQALKFGYLERAFNNRIVTDQSLLNYYIANKLRKRGTDRGYYTSAEITLRDLTCSAFVWARDIGDKITIDNDDQTRNLSTLNHVISGIEGHWKPNDMVMDYYFSPLY